MKKRLAAFVMALAVIFACVPTCATAAAEKTPVCADVTAELLPEDLQKQFTLHGLPEVLTDYGVYVSADSFDRVGKAIVYNYRNVCGLVDKDGSVLTDPIYSSPYKIYGTDMVFLPLADGSGIHVLNDRTGVLIEDLLVDADETCRVHTAAGMCSVEMDGKTVILSSEGEILQKGLSDIVSYLPLAEGAMAVGNSEGLYAVVNRTGMTDFRYSQIGGGNSPNCRSGMVYATRGDLAGFINLETLEEAAFRYGFGSTITSTGIVSSGYVGNYAMIVRQDPDTYDRWYDVLDKSGKVLYSISDDVYSLSGDWFYRDAGLAYLNGHVGKLRLLTLTDEGVGTTDLSGYLKDFRYTTADGVTYIGCFNTFEYGVIEVQDSATGECVLLNTEGQELLRGYDCLDKETDAKTDELICIVAQDAAGKYSFCLPGGSFTGYLYDEIVTYGDYVRAAVTDEKGEVCYQLFSPTGTQLFADLTVTDFTVDAEDNYARALTEEGSYLCHLSSGTVSGPYAVLIDRGQSRFTVPEDGSMIDAKGTVLAEEISGYVGYFSEGFAEYSVTPDFDYRGLIDLDGSVYDFGWRFELLECEDDDYNFDYFYDGTAVVRVSEGWENSHYLLSLNSTLQKKPDPQLLYSAPANHAVGLPLFGTITLTFDRPVTLPDEEDVQLVCVSDGEEIGLSVVYGNSSQTVLRFTLQEEMMACGEKYALLIGSEAIWPLSGEEKKPFAGFTQEDDFTFTISEDGLTLSDLDLIRYFPQCLFNKTASSFESAAADAYVDIIDRLTLSNDLRISLFHALRDPVNAFAGYIPGVSAARHTQLVNETAYALMGAVTQQPDQSEIAKNIAVWAESVSWAGKLSEDDAFVEGLGVLLNPTDLDQFAGALQKLDEAADAMTFGVDLCSIRYTIVTTELMNRVTIEAIRDSIPYDCHLKQGLTSLLRSIDDPNYLVEKYLLDNRMLKVICNAAEDVVFSEAGMLIGAKVGADVVLDGGVVMYAKLILQSFSLANDLLGGASYNDINELLLLSGFTAALNSAVISCRAELVKTGEDCTQEMADEYRMLYSAYLTCLKLTLQSAANIATPAEMGGDISMRTTATTYANALDDGTYSYDVYMDLCKKNALNEASSEYLYDVVSKTNSAVLTGTPALPSMAVALLSGTEEESGTSGESGTPEEENGEPFLLPDQIDGYPVTSVGVGPWTGNEEMTVLVIPDTVEEIGEGAFAGCGTLKYVVLGENVVSVGQDAFSGCGELISVSLPGGLETVGSGAFADCDALSRVSVAADEVQADSAAFPENVCFSGTQLSCAASLAEQFAGTAMISPALEDELELLCEPDRLYYAPEEPIDGEGMLLEADGAQVEDGWVICRGTDADGEPVAVVHYLGKKTTFPIFVGEDELHFPNLYHLQVPTWEEGTAIAAAYDSNNRLTEVFLFEDAFGTVFVLPWQTRPDHVKGFLLGEGGIPLTEHTCLTGDPA